MNCKKCGNEISDTDKFCNNCGEAVVENTYSSVQTSNVTVNNAINDNYNQMNNNMNNQQYQANNGTKDRSVITKVLATIGGVVVGIVVVADVIISLVSASSEKMVCKSKTADITIMYKGDKLTGYKAKGQLNYNFDEGKEATAKVGVEQYLQLFSKEFSRLFSGTCTIDGEVVE